MSEETLWPITEAEANEAWQEACAKHGPSSYLFRLAMHIQKCEKCRKAIEGYAPPHLAQAEWTQAELEALDTFAEENGPSWTRHHVLRQALRLYQLTHARVKAGESCAWSGDAERAREFAGTAAQPAQAEIASDGELRALRSFEAERNQRLTAEAELAKAREEIERLHNLAAVRERYKLDAQVRRLREACQRAENLCDLLIADGIGGHTSDAIIPKVLHQLRAALAETKEPSDDE